MTAFYLICIFISIAIYIWMFITDVKKSLSQNIMMILMILSNIGYFSLSISTDLSSANISNKIAYLGGCFLPLAYFFTVCEVCHVNLKKRIMFVLTFIQCLVFFCVCTIGYSDIYYKNVSFDSLAGTGYLVREYGPTHILHPLTLVLLLAAAIGVTAWTCFSKKMTNRKELIKMMIFASISVSCYIFQKILKINFDIAPISYLFLMYGSLAPIYHSNLYTVYENSDIIHEQINRVGFITFNKKLNYMGANECALKIFEELQDCQVGYSIKNASDKLKELLSYVNDFSDKLPDSHSHHHTDEIKFSVNDRIFDMEIHTLNNFAKRCVGFIVELEDETDHYEMIELTESYNEKLTKEVEEKTVKIRQIQSSIVLGMAQMVESRDLSTGGHIKRTSDVVKIFAKRLIKENYGLDERFLKLVIRSAPMHDLGKIGVDDAVLRKQGKFTDEEYEKMKTHAQIGGKMVKEILSEVEDEDFVRVAFNVANYHHEKVNGKGYPTGISGDDIPIEARIMALADVFDALVSKRCYKDAFSYDKAFFIIESDAGIHFDKELAGIFIKCRKELEDYYNSVA